MELDEIRELITLMEQSNLSELTFEQDGVRLHLKKPFASSPVTENTDRGCLPAISKQQTPKEQPSTTESSLQEEQATDASLRKIVSPMVGTFYRAPAPDADPYVDVGDRVSAKTVVCIVEAMKLMNEIEAEVEGEIVKILVENGQLVEYGQPLFLVKTD